MTNRSKMNSNYSKRLKKEPRKHFRKKKLNSFKKESRRQTSYRSKRSEISLKILEVSVSKSIQLGIEATVG